MNLFVITKKGGSGGDMHRDIHSWRTRFLGDAGDSREKAVGETGRDSGMYSD